MDPIRFTTTIGEDQTIRPPSGVSLPDGEFEVTVRPVVAKPVADDPDEVTSDSDWLMGIVAEMTRNAPDLPANMAENHDHSDHEKPLPRS